MGQQLTANLMRSEGFTEMPKYGNGKVIRENAGPNVQECMVGNAILENFRTPLFHRSCP